LAIIIETNSQEFEVIICLGDKYSSIITNFKTKTSNPNSVYKINAKIE